jgi:hypothetical protein
VSFGVKAGLAENIFGVAVDSGGRGEPKVFVGFIAQMRRKKRRKKKGLRILRARTWKVERVVVESLWDQMVCRFYEEMREEQGRGGHWSRVFWER